MSKLTVTKSSKDGYRKLSLKEGNWNQNTGEGSTPGTSSSYQTSEQMRSRQTEEDEKNKGSFPDKMKKIKECKDFAQDMAELQSMWSKISQQMKELIIAKIIQSKWDRYMQCDGSPNPVDQREINTYISLRLEDTSRDDAESVLQDSQLDLQLVAELNFLLLNSTSEVLGEDERVAIKQTIEKLEKLIICKLDMATLQVMKDATIKANKETGNLQYSAVTDNIALCVWGNIMKNPRIRSYEFSEINFTFDIPRMIVLTDCAVRVLTTRFDPYSPTSKTIIPRVAAKGETKVAKKESIEEKKEPEPEETEQEENADGEKEEEKAEEAEVKDEPKTLVTAALSLMASEMEREHQEEETQELEDEISETPTPEILEWEDFDEAGDVIDLRAYSVVGCIYHFNLLQLPPQPKFVRSWTITQLVDPPEICYLDYVGDPAFDGNKPENKRNENPPLTISLIYPNDVVFIEQPQVAFWHYERKLWMTEGVTDIIGNEEARQITFKSTRFGTFCLLQDTHVNMPFQTWRLRPHKLNNAVFMIKSSFITIEIEIKDEFCSLKEPRANLGLQSIIDKWVSPAELIVMMRKAGVHFFPNEDSTKYVSIPRKHPLIEEHLYQQMALTASAVAYSWSQWNLKVGEKNEIIFCAAESLMDYPIPEEKWITFLATKHQVTKLRVAESGRSTAELKREEFPSISEDGMLPDSKEEFGRVRSRMSKSPRLMRRPSTHKYGTGKRLKGKEGAKTPREEFMELFNFDKPQYKSDMYHFLLSFATEHTIYRINNTSFQFIHCVYKLLSGTKVLSYS